MSEKLYTIQEQTLTDIANAIRQKNPETELAIGPCPAMITKSPNAIGHDDVVGEGVESLIMYTYPTRIEGAVSIKVIISYYLRSSDDLIMYPGYYTQSDKVNGRIPINGSVNFNKENVLVSREEYIFANQDAVTFYAQVNPNTATGYYIEIIGYDAYGIPVATENTIEIETERPALLSFTSAEMAAAIGRIPEVQRVEPVVLTGSGQYACAGAIASKYIELFGDTVSTSKITNTTYMFQNSTLNKIPFDINMDATTYRSMQGMFNGARNLTEAPVITNAYPERMDGLFENCQYLRELPENFGEGWRWDRAQSYTYAYVNNIFANCYSLRKVPQSFIKNLWGVQTSTYSWPCYQTFNACYVLDEVKDFPIGTATITSNGFSGFVNACGRLKTLTFATNEDGSPKVAKWKSQTIDLTNNNYPVGHSYLASHVLNYNSGITADKEVKDDATYQALKNDPDWFTANSLYSRYNHDSAVATINSLPDTSAYLATQSSGTNTIKFRSRAGELTDGGAINTLTAEEIAVATSRGWTVTLV